MVDQIVMAALDAMSEVGAAGLRLGEVAKRMGMRTPSLYVYVPSKAALCDEIFRRGWTDLREAVRPHLGVKASADLTAHVEHVLRAIVAWSLEHPSQAQLMMWRPVAGWQPSPEAYTPAVDFLADMRAELDSACDAGLLVGDSMDMAAALSIMSTGVISQQLSNEPGVDAAHGTYAAHLGRLAELFVGAYGAPRSKGDHR